MNMQEEIAYEERQAKPFRDVTLGDIANDYGGYDFPVIGKGTLREVFDLWGHRSALGLQDMIQEGDPSVTEDTPAIAVLSEPHFQGDVIIYLYSPEGAQVYIKSEEVLVARIFKVACIWDFPEYASLERFLDFLFEDEDGDGPGDYGVPGDINWLVEQIPYIEDLLLCLEGKEHPDDVKVEKEEIQKAIETIALSCQKLGIDKVVFDEHKAWVNETDDQNK